MTNQPPPMPATDESPGSQTCGLAIASMICGLFGFLTAGISGIVGVVLGHVGLSRIKRSAGALKGRGMAITGLVTGYVTALILPIALIAGLTAPTILRHRKASERTMMVNHAKQLGMAMIEFEVEYGEFPSDATAPVVAETTGSGLPMTGADVFNQLEAFGVPNVQELLTVGSGAEGDWTYISGLSSDDASGQPLLISPEVGGETIVLRVDTSVERDSVAEPELQRLRSKPEAITVPAPRR